MLPYEDDEPTLIAVDFSDSECDEPYLLNGVHIKGKYYIEECPQYAHNKSKVTHISELSEIEETLVRQMHEITKSFGHPKEMNIIFKTCLIKIWKNIYE